MNDRIPAQEMNPGADSPYRVVVVGNGMIGHHFIDQLLDLGEPGQFEIVTFGEEPRVAYDRMHLTGYFETRSAEPLMMTSAEDYERQQVRVFLNDKVVSINREARTVESAQGRIIGYDRLVLATGSYPFVPPIPGNDRNNCFVYRTIEDVEAIAAAAEQGARVGAVVGGGLLGLEAAKALQDLGLETHVVEFAPRLMAVQVDDAGGALLREKIEALGVGVLTSKATEVICDGEQARHRMQFTDGSHLDTDLIVFSAGIRPRDELARAAGLDTGERGGIVIDNHCLTSDDSIYAIGECAAWQGRCFGLVAPGNAQAKVAAAHIAGIGQSFEGADLSTKLKLMGVDVASIGDAHGQSPGARSYSYCNQPEGVYKKLVVSEDGQLLLGAVLVGDASDYGTLLQYKLNAMTLPDNPETLILPATSGDQPALGVAALPDSAQICSCHDVSKAAISGAVRDGASSVGEVKTCTKAGTGCGGCVPLLTSVVNHELEAQGVAVSKDICEHFAFSRQELFHLVRVGGIRTFAELLEKHGRGHGCEICKPAVGSILASCWNDYVLRDEHIGLQDTNDLYLGNMQKDGTYSVVPRIAGGEITPEKLIILGEVARDFGLYTKVTGGQRIDMFGAQLHQLPEIWQRLVDAGFETGHAYGKSLRTVKSCVGSSWCRFGVDDSVGLAIDLENRYKGLRAPHKIKFGVSGCTRECAEAQSKDIGVIATENGWNLYVCGNGGMKPRHADLFASDLDTETLVRTIDRLLMFYIRTADRLQRTSVWMDNLEGGIDYLRQVILEDSLGIADELEADMNRTIGNYQCEWATTLKDPEKLKRFSHFINSDEADSNVVFVNERSQPRPATDRERRSLATPVV